LSDTTLTAKQALFVAHYLDCLNATEAARRAGYAGNDNTLASVGRENLRKPQIRTAVTAGLSEKAMPADEVLARLAEIARADVRALMQFSEADADGVPAGSFVGLRLERGAPLHLVKKLTPTRYGMAVELHDAHAALTTLAKVHGLLGGVDWTKIPQSILDALADGRLTVDDLKRLAAPSQD
jgi:phage terminase small subunit